MSSINTLQGTKLAISLLYTYVYTCGEANKCAKNLKIRGKLILYGTSIPSNSFEPTPSQTSNISLVILQLTNREERSTSLGKGHTISIRSSIQPQILHNNNQENEAKDD